jgi:hypothetical protein
MDRKEAWRIIKDILWTLGVFAVIFIAGYGAWRGRKAIEAILGTVAGRGTRWVPDPQNPNQIFVKTEAGMTPCTLPAGILAEHISQIVYDPAKGITVEVNNEAIDRRVHDSP